MDYVPYKKRTEEEIKNFLKDYESGMSNYELSKKYDISDDGIYALIKASRGIAPYPSNKQQSKKIEKLEKQLAEREKEIALLRAALKKS